MKLLKDQKIELEIVGFAPKSTLDFSSVHAVRVALPFYRSRRGKYIHRVRYAHNHWNDDRSQISHMSMHLWCGQSGSSTHGHLVGQLQEGDVLCAVCEGKVIGTGIIDAGKINGRAVKYSPRRSYNMDE